VRQYFTIGYRGLSVNNVKSVVNLPCCQSHAISLLRKRFCAPRNFTKSKRKQQQLIDLLVVTRKHVLYTPIYTSQSSYMIILPCSFFNLCQGIFASVIAVLLTLFLLRYQHDHVYITVSC
jgi:hypothetical protein